MAEYNSDYGRVPVEIIEEDENGILVSLKNDTPPLGDEGDESWVDKGRVEK